MTKTKLEKEIKNWLKDYEKNFQQAGVVPDDDEMTFEGSAYQLLSKVFNQLKERKKELKMVMNTLLEEDAEAFEENGNEIPKDINDLQNLDWEFSPLEMACYHLGKFDVLSEWHGYHKPIN